MTLNKMVGSAAEAVADIPVDADKLAHYRTDKR
jgi:hypothetical protein